MSITFDDILTSADTDYLASQSKTMWQHDRRLQNLPTCKLHRYRYTGADASAGIVGSQVDDLNTTHNCSYRDYTLTEIIASGGALMRGMAEVVIYDGNPVVGTDILEFDGYEYRIVGKQRASFSGRCILTVEPSVESES